MAVLADQFISSVNDAGESLVVFAVVRNEAMRLPGWLHHYRNAGVKQFAIIDNGSEDETFEFLAAQRDVALQRIHVGFAQSNFGMDWANEFRDRIAPGTWVLVADADECMIYRNWPELPLPAFVDLVRNDRKDAVLGFLLDMYPDGFVEDAVVPEGRSLFDVAPCFDADYRFRNRPRKPWEADEGTVEVVGGPRLRLLSSFEREIRSTWLDYWIRGQIDRILPRVPDSLVPIVVKTMPRQMPALTKVPLSVAGARFQYSDSHSGSGGRFFHENVSICHFKFLADFDARVRTEAARGEHYRRGAEYIMYAEALDQLGRIDLRYGRTRRFESADQLVELGFIRDLAHLDPDR
jgi:hypothetical protein